MFFTSDRIVRGVMTGQYDKPDWGSLEELALHLDKGRAFVHIWPEEIRDDDEPGSYREVDPQRILREVLRRRSE